ncbi:MAG: DUF1015 domain-containing protein [Bdellovibrionota bacterium]
MPDVLPFRGHLYDLSKAAAENLVAPPYDVLSDADRAKLAGKSPLNVVHVDLPKQEEAPGAKDKYDAAAKIWMKWLAEKAIQRDSEAVYYRYRQDFTLPGDYSGKTHSRGGLIAAVRLYDFKEGIILPHEKTLDGPKQDRLSLTEATRMNLSPTFSFYFDPEGKIRKAMGEPGTPWADFTDDAGVRHRLWRITDKNAQKAIQEAFSKRKLYIADGHHRYTTAIHYREKIRKETGAKNHPADFGMMFVAEASEMTVLAYHRMLLAAEGMPGRKKAHQMLQELSRFFLDERFSTKTPQERTAFLEKLGSCTAACALGIVGPGHAHLLQTSDPKALAAAFPSEVPAILRGLDVAVLQEIVLRQQLGVDPQKIAQGGVLGFSPNASVIFDAVDSDKAQLGFLLRPTRVEQVRDVAEAGEVMPQKSTYFYPKVYTGLVFRSLESE